MLASNVPRTVERAVTGMTDSVPVLHSPAFRGDDIRLRPSESGAHLVAWSLSEGEEKPVVVGRFDFTAPAPFPLSVRAAKRALDIVSSSVALVLLSPLFLALSIIIKASSKGPVLYRQERVSQITATGERTFNMVKFRTMVSDAEKLSGPVWAGEDDPRITRLGRFMRKTRLDEFPQFWNVLTGEMSLVGPRPERPFFTEKLQQEIPVYADRVTTLKPGITGWAQVRLPYDDSLDSVRNKVMYDVAYGAQLYRLSTYLRIEVRVIALTFVVVLTGKGAR